MPRTVSFEPSTLEKLGTFLMQSGGVLGGVARQRLDDEEIRQRTLERLARMLEGLQGQQFQAQHLGLQERRLTAQESEAERQRAIEAQQQETVAGALGPVTEEVSPARTQRLSREPILTAPLVTPKPDDLRLGARPGAFREVPVGAEAQIAPAETRERAPQLPEILQRLAQAASKGRGVSKARLEDIKGLFPPKKPPISVAPGARLIDPETFEERFLAPERPEKPEAPTSERTIREAAIDELREAGAPAPTEGQIARRALVIKERLAKAGKTEINLGSASEREAEVKARGHLEIAKAIEATAARRPDFFGGPLGLRGTKQKFLEALDRSDPEFPEFRANVDKLRAELINALAGAAIGPEEAKNYLASVPQVGINSSQQFRANLRVTVQNIEALQRYRAEVLARGFKPGQAGAPLPPPPGGGGSALPPGFTPGMPPRR